MREYTNNGISAGVGYSVNNKLYMNGSCSQL